jgi:hypothetical protein
MKKSPEAVDGWAEANVGIELHAGKGQVGAVNVVDEDGQKHTNLMHQRQAAGSSKV